ncbi:hypothetical protein [Shewanella sp.]|uniref:hypothetical protein n=1 Tax=Shewanella sp. TaxID=50422 RepID=UPI003F306D8F
MTKLTDKELTVIIDWAVANLNETIINDIKPAHKEQFSSTYKIIENKINLDIIYLEQKIQTREYLYTIVYEGNEITIKLTSLDNDIIFEGSITRS